MAAKKLSMVYDYTRMMSDAVGAKHGIASRELDVFAKKAASATREVAKLRSSGKLPYMELPYQAASAKEAAVYAERAAEKFDDFVVLGIGGSALGTICLMTALKPPFYNMMQKAARGGRPRIFVEDNVDPVRIANLLEVINPKKTLFNVVTKSGGTAETMSAFMIVMELLTKHVGAKKVKQHIVATTDVKQGNLRLIADREGFDTFVVPDGVGGRFSVLSAVGLLPAAMAGIDIKRLLAGAAAMDSRCRAAEIASNPALAAASLQYLACEKKGKTIQVMMPYSNRLRDAADWYRQLWAESLGKKFDVNGKVVNAGQTPIKALGATDQHSQVQLYNEGPHDKTFTLMRVEKHETDIVIPKVFEDISGVSYLGGKSMGELLNAECVATEMALTQNNRPNSCIVLPAVDEYTIGQLLYMLEVQTSYAGVFFNINPYDQPGVEQGKIATFALMGRKGYKEQADVIRKYSKALKPRKV